MATATVTATAATTASSPLAGDGGVQSPPLFCVQATGGDEPRPWPYRSTITVRFMDSVHPFVRMVLVSARDEWRASQPSEEISIKLVETGAADVRFAMDDGVTRCALGVDARSIPQDKPTAVLGLSKWRTGESEIVWDIAELERVARHVWGHVLGLPHAYSANPGWNLANVEQLCSSHDIRKTQVLNLHGSHRLDSASCIMHVDQPAHLASRPSLHASNMAIDTVSARVIGELYPRPPNVDLFQSSVSGYPGWVPDNWRTQRIYSTTTPISTDGWQRIVALNMVDLGTNGKYQAVAYAESPEPGSKILKMHMGARDADSHIYDLSAMFLCFDRSDTRIRTGLLESVSLKGGNWNAATPGEAHHKRFEFIPPFKSKPNVVAFIFQFSMDKNSWIRMSVQPESIDENGFTLNLMTWADTKAYNIGAYWLAHEADDPTIRSGRFAPPEHPAPGWTMEDRGVVKFSRPFPNRPRHLFVGLDHADVRNGVNARFKCEPVNCDENGMEIVTKTWHEESRYYKMGASYIALL